MDEFKKVSEFICGLTLEDVPARVVEAAKLCVLDCLGAGIGAAFYEEIPTVVENVLKYSCFDPEYPVAVWGHRKNTALKDGVFLNAMMAHALELDDVHPMSKTHIGTVVVPAAFGVSQARRATGKRFLEAVIAGYEVMARVGMGFGVKSHRLRGWHVTGTAGTFGAAAACAKLFGLSEGQTSDALGMAGTQSSGLWAFLQSGASCKKLHPARAAQNGVTAALMALSGMTGPRNVLTAPDGGLYPATSDEYDVTKLDERLGERYELLYMDKKPYPCCRSTHCAIDAALELTEKQGLCKDEIRKIDIHTYEIGVIQCGSEKYPLKPVEAKFSTPFAVASAIACGRVGTREFEPERIADPALKKLFQKISVFSSDDFTKRYPEMWGCRMDVAMEDGRVFSKTVDDASGSVHRPMSEIQVRDKFKTLTVPVIGEEASESVAALVSELQNREVLCGI